MAMAEKRFLARDFPAAHMLALEARSLFPSLPGVHAAVAAYRVLRRSAAAQKLSSPKSVEHWQAVLGAAGPSASADYEAVKARYRKLLAPLADPPITAKRAAGAAGEALELVEGAWRELEATRSPTSHPAAAARSESSSRSSSGGSPALQDENAPLSVRPPAESAPTESAKRAAARAPSPLAAADADADENVRNKLAFYRISPTPMAMAVCRLCNDWAKLAVVDGQLRVSCVACGTDCSPRCGECRGLYKARYVTGRYILLDCAHGCAPVIVRRAEQPSRARPRPLSPTMADGVLISNISNVPYEQASFLTGSTYSVKLRIH